MKKPNIKVFEVRHWFSKKWFYQENNSKKVGPFDSPKQAAYAFFMKH